MNVSVTASKGTVSAQVGINDTGDAWITVDTMLMHVSKEGLTPLLAALNMVAEGGFLDV